MSLFEPRPPRRAPAPGRLARPWARLRARLPLLGAAAATAVAVRWGAPPPAPATVEGVAAMLGRAAGARVSPTEFIWEPSRGTLADALLGRRVLFLGAEGERGARDLFRALVRVSREGRPIGVERWVNLTATPLGDEQQLVAAGAHVAFVSRALGRVQGVTVLDLHGRSASLAHAGGWLGRLVAWLETGTAAGLGRWELVLGREPSEASLELAGELLSLRSGEPAALVQLDLRDGRLEPGAGDPLGASVWEQPYVPSSASHDALRVLRRALGTERADALKRGLFLARSSLVRTLGRLRGQRAGAATTSAAPPADDARWPPPDLPPRLAHPLDGEGQWRSPAPSWWAAAVGDREAGVPPLVETLIRPDPRQPFTVVRLVALDTRRLELRMEAGFDEPRPETGPRGRGRIPSDAFGKAQSPVVAAFNGAFQTEHGHYGMVVDGRILLPPKPEAATVATDRTGRAWLGTWGTATELPSWVVSLRQNLDPLIDGATVNPHGRTDWGSPLDGASILTERSALCLTKGGHLAYGWSVEIDAPTLTEALRSAGCQYALHLDMNPGHVGFTYLRSRPGGVDAALLAPEMSIGPRRFVEGSPKDFFYLVVRDPTPRAGGFAWQPDGAAQPEPEAIPAVFQAEVERLGAKIRLLSFAPGRFDWRIRPGIKEQAAWTADGALGAADHARALVAIGLGVAFRKDNRRGLVLDGVVTLPVRADLGLLVTSPVEQRVRIGVAVDAVAPRTDASELPLLVEAGEMRSEARLLGVMRSRAAACTLDDGTLLVATSSFDSPEAGARALLDAGCTRVVALDRGHQPAAFVDRAATGSPPQDHYQDTVLYGLAATARGTARRLEDRDRAR